MASKKTTTTTTTTTDVERINLATGKLSEMKSVERATTTVEGPARNGNGNGAPMHVSLVESGIVHTHDEAFWALLRNATDRISFNQYVDFLDHVMCDSDSADAKDVQAEARARPLPFPHVDSYNFLKVATEVFLMKSCGVKPRSTALALDPTGRGTPDADPEDRKVEEELMKGEREDQTLRTAPDEAYESEKRILQEYEKRYATPGGMIPYMEIIRNKLGDVRLKDQESLGIKCYGILREKLVNPCMLELIWSYWHEEGMLVQAMGAVTMRFQNRKGPGKRDPLANLEIDPLRPINNLLWGWVQDEQHRLSLGRRAYEYDHQYGMSLHGKAVPPMRTADSRSKFIEAFHRLLYLCSEFYKQLDDMTVRADGFPVLNALREVHLLLTSAGQNQFGDLPWMARQEMLMSQWILARPEMREFIPGRIMVAYPELWMDRVDAMKTVQGWSDSSVIHFRELGVFGERILLGVRYGAWAVVFMPEYAANWARFWRPEIQGYMHAYRAVTGVDLTNRDELDNTPPSLHLRRRLAAQVRNA